MNKKQLSEILVEHAKYLKGNTGKRADLRDAHLRDEIRHAAPERVRAVIHSIIARIAMHTDDTLHIAYSVQSLLRQWVSAQTVQRRGLLQSPAPLHTFPQWNADLETAELQIVRRRNVKHAAVAYA